MEKPPKPCTGHARDWMDSGVDQSSQRTDLQISPECTRGECFRSSNIPALNVITNEPWLRNVPLSTLLEQRDF